MKNTSDFNISVTCRHEEFSNDFKESIINQLHKLSKFYNNIIKANVTIDKQSSFFRVEVSVYVPGSVIIATYKDYDSKKAIDTAIEKVERQIKKLKSKIKEHRALPTIAAIEMEDNKKIEDFE